LGLAATAIVVATHGRALSAVGAGRVRFVRRMLSLLVDGERLVVRPVRPDRAASALVAAEAAR
jgi:hypothetical protein